MPSSGLVPMYDDSGNIIGYEDAPDTSDPNAGADTLSPTTGQILNGVMTYPTDPGNGDGTYVQNANGWVAATSNPTDHRLADGTQTAPVGGTSNSTWDAIVNRYFPNGTLNAVQAIKDFGSVAAALYAFDQARNPPKTGYQGGIPSLVATRAQVPTAAQRPGAGGQRYLTDVNYSTATELPAAQTANNAQLAALTTQNQTRAAAQPTAFAPTTAQVNSFYGKDHTIPLKLAPSIQGQTPEQKAGYYNNLISQGYTDPQIRAAAGTQTDADWKYLQQLAGTQHAAQGGLMGLARGGSTTPRYLQGNTDGMADKIPAQIDGQQPAALAHGEFVVPADVVSHLGNGNSDAGADVLYKMMDKIRTARTGTKKQGRQINPEKFTPGGHAFAAGGSVQHFDGGGATSTTPSTTPSGTVGTESSLSNWAGPYVTNMLAQGQALANQPYQAYQGPLTAGDSPLQSLAYNYAAGLQTPAAIQQGIDLAGQAANQYASLGYTTPAAQAAAAQASSQGYTPVTADSQGYSAASAASKGYNATNAGQVTLGAVPLNTYQANLQNYQMGPADVVGTDKFTDAGVASSYMSPYVQQSLDPQIREAQRQALVTQQQQNAQMASAGAFGGSRNAIMTAEANRNLGTNLANITGQGYNTAYNTAMQQYSTDAARKLAAAQANQQANLTVGGQNLNANLSTQALRTNTGLQAALANQQMQGQYGIAQGNLTQGTNLANANAANQASQFGAAAANAAALANAGFANQAGQFNAGAANAAALANAGFANQAGQFNAGAANQASLANAGYANQANLANAAAVNQNNQFGASYGLQALAGQTNAANLLGSLGVSQNQVGLANLNMLAGLGATQQATAQAGLTADQAAFNAERDNPYKMVQFQQSLLQGLPLAAQSYNIVSNPYSAAANALTGVGSAPT